MEDSEQSCEDNEDQIESKRQKTGYTRTRNFELDEVTLMSKPHRQAGNKVK